MDYLNLQDRNMFFAGHVACPGCVEALAMRVILNTIGPDAIAIVTPSCNAVICGVHPYSALNIPVQHTTLESGAASASGLRRALNARGETDTTVIVLEGDDGTLDIGFQALSSAVERNEDFIYFCFDNEGYMNTGAQKSSSTPLYAATGSTLSGKLSKKKNLIELMAAHEIPYTASTAPGHLDDMARKIEKAKKIKGTKVISVLIPCLPGWGVADNMGVTVSRLAVETGIFPLYEVEDGYNYTLNVASKNKPVTDYFSLQKRYQHLSREEIDEIQAAVDKDWARLLHKVAIFANVNQ